MDPTRLEAEVRTSIDHSRRAASDFHKLGKRSSAKESAVALDAILRPINEVKGRTQLFANVHPDEALRETARKLEQEIAAWTTELSLDRGIYEGIAHLEAAIPDSGSEGRVIELWLRAFRRSGVDRDEATRKRITDLKDEILRTGQTFDKNITEGSADFVIADGRAGLAGLPQDFIDAHPEREDGAVVLTTDPQDRMPFMTFAERADLRRDYHKLALQRAYPQNLEVLRSLLQKRHELANLLGFANWADYVTEDKMVGSGTEARAFLERIVELCRPRAERDYAALLQEKQRDDASAELVYEHERGYLGERIRKRDYAFDSQAVRPYFPYARVRDGILATSARLYGVDFVKVDTDDAWHEAVECYEVVDEGEVVARFWLDMHARPGKYKHAAMFDMRDGFEDGPLPEACLVCNFPQPKGDDPGLMLRSEVRTYFHEFGHLLHHLFSRLDYVRLSGISCEWDFVEVPSQLYEEWGQDLAVLQTFARHYKTNEAIPGELFDRMLAAEDFGRGLGVMTQMYYALLSLSYYEAAPDDLDLEARMIELKSELLPFPHDEGTCFVASFGHLNGYSAMYYTYMWSLVIAKDLFEHFDDGVMDRARAGQYRSNILARGGVKPASELVRAFLGRDYDFAAFERWLNAG